MKINIIGNYFGIDGFSNHTRQLAIALDKLKDVDISMICNRHQGWESQVNDQELQIMLRDPEEANINIMIGQPQYWRLHSTENKPFIGFLVWEGDKIPEYWIPYLLDENVKQIWVPSMHVKQAMVNTMNKINIDDCNIIEKTKIVPHGVDLDIFKPNSPQITASGDKPLPDGASREINGANVASSAKTDITITSVKTEDNFKFLVDKGWRSLLDRGGTQDTIKAYLEEFNEEDKVELIIKINTAYTMGDINMMLKQLKPKNKTSFAVIKFITDVVPFEKLNEIYNLGDVFINSSKAEAFHLGCLQAMACGLPVISNDFGGQTDFINNENGWLLKEGTMKEVTHELEYEGISWKDVNIKELRKSMRDVYNNKEEVKTKSIKSINDCKEFTWNKSAEKAHANLKSISIK